VNKQAGRKLAYPLHQNTQRNPTFSNRLPILFTQWYADSELPETFGGSYGRKQSLSDHEQEDRKRFQTLFCRNLCILIIAGTPGLDSLRHILRHTSERLVVFETGKCLKTWATSKRLEPSV
jgi:hypothetical protein